MPFPERSYGTPLLRAKLFPPRMLAELVSRGRLLDLLDQEAVRPFTLVSAPAGYGKSTLVAQWIKGLEDPVAWLSLDHEERNLRVFFEHVISAIRTCYKGCCEESFSLLEAPEFPGPEVAARWLSNDLATLPGRLVLVLDDYHRAGTPELSELMDGLLKYPTDNFRLLLITRRDPVVGREGGRKQALL